MPLRDNEKLFAYCKSNMDKPWEEWLKFSQSLNKSGKQGKVGLMNANGEQILYKMSRYINYTARHESSVMEGINEIAKYCPNFVQYVGMIKCNIDPFNREAKNPFEIKSKYPIKDELMLSEYLGGTHKFMSYINTEDVDEKILYSIIKQIILAVLIAQRQKKFTHYDLHSENIMIKKCDKDLVMLYVIDKDNQFSVPTHGYYPIIIDYGFSYIDNLDDGPLWPSMDHTNVGFMSDRFNWVADPLLFLVTTSNEIKDERRTKDSSKFKRLVKNMFFPLTIDWECGWDDVKGPSSTKYVTNMMKGYIPTESQFFTKYYNYCIDILQTLVIMPVSDTPYEDIGKNTSAFMKEWLKIETLITCDYYNLYVLKGVVDAARFVQAAYIDPTLKSEAINTFSKMVLSRIDEISKFCKPKKINFELMLCSLILLGRNIEGIIHEFVGIRMEEKQKEYNDLPINCVEHVYAVLETNLPSKYVYNKHTKIHVINSITKDNTDLKLSTEQLETINSMNFLTHGTAIFDYLMTKIGYEDEEIAEFEVGDNVIYKNFFDAIIKSVHFDIDETFYTITMGEKEIQTESKNLKLKLEI
jgi:hypothetical protein